MTGYKAPRRGVIARFEDHPGLEVRLRRVSVNKLTGFALLIEEIEAFGGAEEARADPKAFAAVEKVLRKFASLIEAWNLEDEARVCTSCGAVRFDDEAQACDRCGSEAYEEEDRPVPATYEGLVTQDLDFIMELLSGAMETITSAPPPLPGRSSSGGSTQPTPELEVTIPMTPIQDSIPQPS